MKIIEHPAATLRREIEDLKARAEKRDRQIAQLEDQVATLAAAIKIIVRKEQKTVALLESFIASVKKL